MTALDRGYMSDATDVEVFVPVREHKLTLGFFGLSSANRVDVTAITDGRKAPMVRYSWNAAEPIEAFLENFDVELRQTFGANAPRLDAKSVFTSLARTLAIAFRRQVEIGGPTSKKPPVIELPTDHWLVTKRGLTHVDEPSATFSTTVVRNAGPSGPSPDQLSEFPHSDELPYAWSAAYARFTEG